MLIFRGNVNKYYKSLNLHVYRCDIMQFNDVTNKFTYNLVK